MLVFAGAVSSVAACGGRELGGRDAEGTEAGAPSSAGSVESGGAAALPSIPAGGVNAAAAAGGAPAVPTSFPDTAIPCPGSDWENCIELSNEAPLGLGFVAVTPDDELVLAGIRSNNPRSGFVAKYTAELESIWFKALDSNMADVQGLAVDGAGNCFLLGRASYGGVTAVQKLAPNGKLLWTQRWPRPADSGLGLAVDGDGNAVVASADKSSFNLAKYSSSGEPLWRADRLAEEREVVNHLAADAQGNVFVAADRALSSGDPWLSGSLEKHSPSNELTWSVSLDGALVTSTFSAPGGDAVALLNIPSTTLVRFSDAGDVRWRKELALELGYNSSSSSNGNIWVAGYRAAPNLGKVVEYSSEGHAVFSKEFSVPTYIGQILVAPMSDGRAYVVGTEDFDHPNVVIARVDPSH